MIFGAINSLITSFSQKNKANKINPVNATYELSPEISSLHSEGKNLYGGRMAGAVRAEQNILSNQATAVGRAQRSATDASQLFMAGADAQTNTNNQFNDLAMKEAIDKQNRFGILSNTSQLMTQERDKIHQDKLRKYYDDLNYKRALEGASQQNKANFFGGLDNAAMAVGSMMMPGGALTGLMGGGAGKAAGGMSQATADMMRYGVSNPLYGGK